MTQKGRVLEISTPLGKDFLLPWKMTAKEEISGLFSIEMEFLHQEVNKNLLETTIIKPESILGKPVTISVTLSGKERRYISGIVNRFSQGRRSVVFSHYHATIVPHIWVLTQNFQSRIFQDMKVPDILLKVFDGFTVIPEMRGDHKPRNYVVQYRESDFDFASRLMQEEGIFYYFLHEDGMDKLVLADTPDSHRDTPAQTDFTYYHTESEGKLDLHHITSWQTDHELGSGKLTLWDHHFEKPQDNFNVEQPSRYSAGGKHEMEIYDFPGGYAQRYDGIDKGGKEQPNELVNIYDERKKDAEIRMTAFDSHFEISHGVSRCVPFVPGHKFKLNGHANKELNKQYMLLSVDITATQFPAYLGDMETADEPYENTFRCIPLGAGAPPYRPLRKTSKPIVHGLQTATVVGRPGDEEIFTDKYGRVKVMFHWDREQKKDPSSSAWLRVAKDLAGNKWGTMYIPRVGQEVMVAFLHGDPNQPIVVGSVYNAETMPHYELPKFKTLTYIKTRTTPDDGKGYNELRFEDKANKEQVFIRSQKRMDVRVRGSLYETCGGSRQEVIGLKQENQPGGNLAVTVAGNYDLHVKEGMYIGIDQKLNETVKSDVAEDYQGKQQTVVKGKRELNAQEITLEALSKITLKVGGSFVSIDLSGVTISGPMVKINSGGAGAGTGPMTIDDPLDAETSDTGEPGYLERPRRGGGGGRRRRTVTGQHAPPFATTTLPDGSIRVGNSLVIRPSATDPDFQNKVLNDLTTMSNHPTGMNTLNSINNGGNDVNINHTNVPGGNATGPHNANDAAAAGAPALGGGTGTGNGTGSDISYNPDFEPPTAADPSVNRPADVGLHHELGHADRNTQGISDLSPDTVNPNNGTVNETAVVDRDNEYRDERGIPRRADHTVF